VGNNEGNALGAERTCNAQMPDVRNWLAIQALDLHVHTIRSVAARFALHVFSRPVDRDVIRIRPKPAFQRPSYPSRRDPRQP
jgi:hypothetical protein